MSTNSIQEYSYERKTADFDLSFAKAIKEKLNVNLEGKADEVVEDFEMNATTVVRDNSELSRDEQLTMHFRERVEELRNKSFHKGSYKEWKCDIQAFITIVSSVCYILTSKQRSQIIGYVLFIKIFKKGELAGVVKNNPSERIDVSGKYSDFNDQIFLSSEDSAEDLKNKNYQDDNSSAYQFANIFDAIKKAKLVGTTDLLTKSDKMKAFNTLYGDMKLLGKNSINTYGAVSKINIEDRTNNKNTKDYVPVLNDIEDNQLLKLDMIASFIYEDVIKVKEVVKISKKKQGNKSLLTKGDELFGKATNDEDGFASYEDDFM